MFGTIAPRLQTFRAWITSNLGGSSINPTRFLREDNTLAVPAATVSGGTAGRIPFEGAGGVLTDSIALQVITGVPVVCGPLNLHDSSNSVSCGQINAFSGIISIGGRAGACPFNVDVMSGYSGTAIYNPTQPITLGVGQGIGGTGGTTILASGLATRTPAAILGFTGQTAPLLEFQQISSASVFRNCGYIDTTFNVSTDAVWTGRVVVQSGSYQSSNLARYTGISATNNASVPMLQFFGTGSEVVQPVLSYSRSAAGETAAGAAMRVALASLGLVLDSTTA